MRAWDRLAAGAAVALAASVGGSGLAVYLAERADDPSEAPAVAAEPDGGDATTMTTSARPAAVRTTTTEPRQWVDCGNSRLVATETALGAVEIVDAVRTPPAQRACRNLDRTFRHYGEGTIEECADVIDRASAKSDLAVVLPDGELQVHLTRTAGLERDAAQRCLDSSDPDELLYVDETPLRAFIDRLYQLGVDVHDNTGEV